MTINYLPHINTIHVTTSAELCTANCTWVQRSTYCRVPIILCVESHVVYYWAQFVHARARTGLLVR